MITLTVPPAIVSVLGGSGTVLYDKLVVEANFSPGPRQIVLRLLLTSSIDLDAQPITGSGLVSLLGNASIEIRFEQLDFHRKQMLGGAAVNAVQAIIDGAQNGVEQGLIDLGLVAGLQAPGV